MVERWFPPDGRKLEAEVTCPDCGTRCSRFVWPTVARLEAPGSAAVVPVATLRADCPACGAPLPAETS